MQLMPTLLLGGRRGRARRLGDPGFDLKRWHAGDGSRLVFATLQDGLRHIIAPSSSALGGVARTKYRYPVLGGDVGVRCRELLRETARAHEMAVLAGSINRDHVHMLLSIPPSLSVSRAAQHLKGRSSHKLLSEFGVLRKRYWGQHLWARGYWVVSSGNVTDDMWVEYIKNQTPPEPDDNFNVT